MVVEVVVVLVVDVVVLLVVLVVDVLVLVDDVDVLAGVVVVVVLGAVVVLTVVAGVVVVVVLGAAVVDVGVVVVDVLATGAAVVEVDDGRAGAVVGAAVEADAVSDESVSTGSDVPTDSDAGPVASAVSLEPHADRPSSTTASILKIRAATSILLGTHIRQRVRAHRQHVIRRVTFRRMPPV